MDLLKLLIFILLVFFTEYNFKFTNLFVTKEGFEDKFSFNTKENFSTEEYSPGCYIVTRNCNDNEYWKEKSTGEWYNDEVDGVAPVNSKEECNNKQTSVNEMCGTRAYVRNMYVPRPNTTLAPTTVAPVTKQPYMYKAGTDVYEFKWNTGTKMTGMYPDAKLLTKDYTKYFHMNILSVILDDLYLSPPEVEIDNIDVTDGWFGGNFRIVAKLYGKLNEETLNEFHDTIIKNTLKKVVEEYNQNFNNTDSTTTVPTTTAKIYNPEELSIVNDGMSNGNRQFILKVAKNGVENKMEYADQVLTPETVTTYVNEENINLNIDPELKKWIMKKLKENPNILPITKNNTEEESKTVKFKCSS